MTVELRTLIWCVIERYAKQKAFDSFPNLYLYHITPNAYGTMSLLVLLNTLP